MKRLLTLLLALVMAIGCFASCKGNNPSSSSSTPGSSSGTGDTGSSGNTGDTGSSGSTGGSTSSGGDETPTVKYEKAYAPEDTGTQVTRDFTKTEYTYNSYTAVSPSNWNLLTYQDNNDTQIMNYLAGSFFSFDFKYNSEGKIIDGEFEVKFDFATALEDVTDVYGEEYGLDPKTPNHVWKITIRNDGKWDDGTPIKAQDFVYSMKEQLNPLFKNYRADSYYNGSVNLVKAWEYVFQGTTDWFAASTPYKTYSESLDNQLYFYLGQKVIGEGDDKKVVESYVRSEGLGLPATYTADKAAAYLKANYIKDLNTDVLARMEGKTFAEIKADAAMKAEWDKLIGWWQTEPNEELHFFVTEATLPELDFSKVGIKAVSDYEIVVAMTDPIVFIEDGKLTYHAPYEFSSLPLVHKEKFEANKVKPATDGALWTSTYNSSAESTASWGPYKLTKYQTGKYYKLEKNPHWYGWNMKKYDGKYQTDAVSCQTIEKYDTAFLSFRKGDLDDIGIDVSVAADYKNSKQAYFTPDDFVGSIQLQSSAEELKKRETAGVNKTILTYADFRKALSLGLNRADFVNKCTTSSLAGFGLYNSMHYIDVANGVTYRSTDAAKKALCEAYAIDLDEFGGDLDEAVASITGYQPNQAKALVKKAYDAALAKGDIKEGDRVVLVYGSSADTESVRRNFDYLNDAWKTLMVGTPLEGRFELKFDASFGSDWANSFRAGGYDICMGGWTGAAWNPGYFIMAYLSPSYMYSKGWDTSAHEIEITVHGVDAEGNVTNDENDVYTSKRPIFGTSKNSWYELLNGKYGQGFLSDEFRCEILGQMEAEVLKQYYTIPYANRFVASLHSFKIDYVTYTYNTFCGYGGIEYLKYNHTDAQWKAYVSQNAQGGELNYK